MPRGPRLDAPGHLSRVMARGLQRRAIFRGVRDRAAAGTWDPLVKYPQRDSGCNVPYYPTSPITRGCNVPYYPSPTTQVPQVRP